jgi:hypothetical protein
MKSELRDRTDRRRVLDPRLRCWQFSTERPLAKRPRSRRGIEFATCLVAQIRAWRHTLRCPARSDLMLAMGAGDRPSYFGRALQELLG